MIIADHPKNNYLEKCVHVYGTVCCLKMFENTMEDQHFRPQPEKTKNVNALKKRSGEV